MRKDTVICTRLVGAFILFFGLLIFSLPWLATLRPHPLTHTRAPLARRVVAPARPSGQAIALTCARMANVDMTPGVLITLAQVQERERCAERMITMARSSSS